MIFFHVWGFWSWRTASRRPMIFSDFQAICWMIGRFLGKVQQEYPALRPRFCWCLVFCCQEKIRLCQPSLGYHWACMIVMRFNGDDLRSLESILIKIIRLIDSPTAWSIWNVRPGQLLPGNVFFSTSTGQKLNFSAAWFEAPDRQQVILHLTAAPENTKARAVKKGSKSWAKKGPL